MRSFQPAEGPWTLDLRSRGPYGAPGVASYTPGEAALGRWAEERFVSSRFFGGGCVLGCLGWELFGSRTISGSIFKEPKEEPKEPDGFGKTWLSA